MLNIRRLLRWGHIVAGGWISFYLFSPLRLDETATFATQIVALSLGLSGAAMWQLPRLTKLSRGKIQL